MATFLQVKKVFRIDVAHTRGGRQEFMQSKSSKRVRWTLSATGLNPSDLQINTRTALDTHRATPQLRTEATSAEYVPAVQLVQTKALVEEYFPAVQLVQAAALVCAVNPENVPAVQLVQTVACPPP